MSEFAVRPVLAEETRGLRSALLRGLADDEDAVWSAGEARDTLCVGGYRDGALVGFATIVRQRVPGIPEANAWRIREIAVDHGHRGFGLGGQMMRRCLEHAAARNARLAWCRVPAKAFGFFQHLGFQRSGDPFEHPGGGPHYLMVARFATSAGARSG